MSIQLTGIKWRACVNVDRADWNRIASVCYVERVDRNEINSERVLGP